MVSSQHLNTKNLASIACLLLLTLACNKDGAGPKKPGVAGNQDADANATNVVCEQGNCPKVIIEAYEASSGGASMSATVNYAVNWSFAARSTQTSTRTFRVFNIEASPQPASMTISGAKSASVQLSWTPTSSDPTSGQLSISVRDVSRCKALSSSPSRCDTDFATSSDYDETQSLSWSIAGTPVTNPYTNPTATIGTGGGGGFLQILMQVGMPLIQSLMSGGTPDFGSILSSMTGALGGGALGGGGLGGLTNTFNSGLGGIGGGLAGLPVGGLNTTLANPAVGVGTLPTNTVPINTTTGTPGIDF